MNIAQLINKLCRVQKDLSIEADKNAISMKEIAEVIDRLSQIKELIKALQSQFSE